MTAATRVHVMWGTSVGRPVDHAVAEDPMAGALALGAVRDNNHGDPAPLSDGREVLAWDISVSRWRNPCILR
jgi:hypothetical protein